MAKWSATASNLPSYGERVISSVKWKAVISEIYDYLHTVRTASYGTVEPTAENGELWYDTNVGQNKLKVKTATGWSGISSDLPIASSTILGGVKVGTNLSITDGVLSADDQSYTLPTATDTILGGIKVGSNLTITDSVLSADDQSYTLPTATDSVLGGIKVGSNLTITDGVLSATDTDTIYTLPTASDSVLGGIKVGNTLTIDSSGVLNAYALNIAGQKIEPSTTPTANKIPVADAAGKIADGWIDAKTILGGAVDPTTEGVDGDWYINRISWHIWEKVSGTWTDRGSIKGTDGADGTNGTNGEGVPTGGTTGQILAKSSSTDYATEWVDAPSGSGGASSAEILTVATIESYL